MSSRIAESVAVARDRDLGTDLVRPRRQTLQAGKRMQDRTVRTGGLENDGRIEAATHRATRGYRVCSDYSLDTVESPAITLFLNVSVDVECLCRDAFQAEEGPQ